MNNDSAGVTDLYTNRNPEDSIKSALDVSRKSIYTSHPNNIVFPKLQ